MPGIVLSRSISTRALAPDVDRALTAAVDGPADPFARTAITLLRRAGLRLGECLDLELDAVVDYNQLSATRYASNWVYDPVTEVDTTEVSSASGVDLIVRDWTSDNSDAWAWVECDQGAAYGGTDPRRWCRPQVLRYDLSDTIRYDEVFERRYMACHEMGHSLGLRHSSNSASCLFPNQATSDVLVANDEVIELNGHY